MEDIYIHLEKIDATQILTDYSFDKKIKQIIIQHRDEALNNNNNSTVHKCQIELDTLNFSTNENKISYILAGTDNEGNPFEYPDIKTFKDEDFKYLSERLKNTTNNYLIARYAHVLWHSSIKHNDYAVSASNSYLKIAQNLYSKMNKENKKSLGTPIINSIKNSVLISMRLKKSNISNLAKEFILKMAHDFSDLESIHINTRLIGFMLENSKLFSMVDFTGLEKEIHKASQEEHGFRKIDLLKLGLRIDIKLGNNNLFWAKEIAESYEEMSYSREDGVNLASTQFAQDAIEYYKKAKELKKTEELTKRYQDLKENMKLSEFSSKVDMTETMSIVEKNSTEISERNYENILYTLMYAPIFPNYDDLEKLAHKQKNENAFEFMSSTSIIDINGHPSEYFSTDDEHIYHAILQNLHFTVQLEINPLLRAIFLKSVLKGNLSANSFAQFMRNKSWLGQTISRKIKQATVENYNWLPLLNPAITDYLVQLHFYLTNQNNAINLVLCIDSLVLKIEGILRDIINMKEGTTFYFTQDKKGNKIAREKDINALLHDEIIKELISKDDLLLLKFILVEKAGLNLRNNIAHSLFRHIENYSIDYMNLLIIAVLKLAKNEYFPLKNNVLEKEEVK